jgi:hypothetical protein
MVFHWRTIAMVTQSFLLRLISVLEREFWSNDTLWGCPHGEEYFEENHESGELGSFIYSDVIDNIYSFDKE